MLKITVEDSPKKITYKLEGKLIGAYARELQNCAESKNKPIVVDLRSVDFIDNSRGRRVLKSLHDAGARFIKGGPLVCAILDRTVRTGVLALPFLPLHAQTPVRLTLRDAIQTALKQNPQIAIANLQIAESQQQANVNRADLLPQVGAHASEAVRRVNLQAQIGIPFVGFPQHVGPFWNSQAGVNFSIPLLDLTAFRRWQASREDIAGARAQETSVREQNVQLVVSQYLGSLRASADVAAARSRMVVAKALLDLATDLQRNGAGTKIDTLRADVQYQNERQRVIVSETEFKTSVYALARLLNIDPRTPVELTDLGSFFETPTLQGTNTVDAAFANRPELQGIESRLHGLELQRSAASAQRLPRLSVNGDWSELRLGAVERHTELHVPGEHRSPAFHRRPNQGRAGARGTRGAPGRAGASGPAKPDLAGSANGQCGA